MMRASLNGVMETSSLQHVSKGELLRDFSALVDKDRGNTANMLAYVAEIDRPGAEDAAVAELARGADLFCCECSFPDAEGVPNHLTPSGAGRLAQAADGRLSAQG